jgi:hypothetical protein
VSGRAGVSTRLAGYPTTRGVATSCQRSSTQGLDREAAGSHLHQHGGRGVRLEAEALATPLCHQRRGGAGAEHHLEELPGSVSVHAVLYDATGCGACTRIRIAIGAGLDSRGRC